MRTVTSHEGSYLWDFLRYCGPYSHLAEETFWLGEGEQDSYRSLGDNSLKKPKECFFRGVFCPLSPPWMGTHTAAARRRCSTPYTRLCQESSHKFNHGCTFLARRGNLCTRGDSGCGFMGV